MAKKRYASRVWVAGVEFSVTTRNEVTYWLTRALENKGSQKLVFVTTPNPEQVVQASGDEEFRGVINRSDIAVADGVGIGLAVEFLGIKPVADDGSEFEMERIAGIDLAEELLRFCGREGLRVFVLGGKLNESDKLKLKEGFVSKFGVSGGDVDYFSGAEDIEFESLRERAESLVRIGRHKPELLLVGYGAPYQEKWIERNREQLEETGVKVAMVVGGGIDVWAGKVGRAPKPVRRLGFEWLWRLVDEPWRWQRQLRLVVFGWMVLKQKISRRSGE